MGDLISFPGHHKGDTRDEQSLNVRLDRLQAMQNALAEQQELLKIARAELVTCVKEKTDEIKVRDALIASLRRSNSNLWGENAALKAALNLNPNDKFPGETNAHHS